MADAIVWSLASRAIRSVGGKAVKKVAFWWGARADVEKLKKTIDLIVCRVDDAERKKEGEDSDSIKKWLQWLKDVLYRANDLFDEVDSLDRLRKQEMENSMPKLWKVGILFTTKFDHLCYNIKVATEIKSIRKELNVISSHMTKMHLVEYRYEEIPVPRLLRDRETSSVLMKKVIGREDDKNKIIKMLLDDSKQFTVIPIVGFGGPGKTTLAQYVFNDDRVKQHFDVTKWAYVPEKNELKKIKGKILQAFNGNGKNCDDKSLDYIDQGIKNWVETEKYLLVLDDLCYQGQVDIADGLKLLVCGKHGSKVILTTRLDKVAEAVGSLGSIEADVDSLELFHNVAFGHVKDSINAELMREITKIVKMCGNVPLAIQVVGGFLKSEPSDRWLLVKDKLQKTKVAGNGQVMTILKLSYDCLPRQSRLCFAYCSLFSKGYAFEKDDLVHQWMAHGYVQPADGDEIFWDLVARNLLQGPKDSHKRDVKEYKMHDLLHEMAQTVAGDEMLEYEDEKQIHDRLVHVNMNGLTCPSSMKCAKRLRSLLRISYSAGDEKLFSEIHSLRVLSMEDGKYEKLPQTIGTLIHLRYLNVGRNDIEYLPDSITRLVNLETLNLLHCYELKELPSDFVRLSSLKHLLLPYNNKYDMPPKFGKLTSLQELNRFFVGEANGIDSLPAWELRGKLCIEFRWWRRDAIEEAKRANLKDNKHLTSLRLFLKFEKEEVAPADGEMKEMVKHLKLPPMLKDLQVRDYAGNELPGGWLYALSQLKNIKISGCKKCTVLPNLSGLPLLKSLELHELYELEYVEVEDNIRIGTATATHNRRFFPSLEVLSITSCLKLKEWRRLESKDEGERRQLVFPNLLRMEVERCHMLKSMPLAPKLESLILRQTDWMAVESNLRSNYDAPSSSSATPSSSTLFKPLKELDITGEHGELSSSSISNSIREHRIQSCSRLKNMSEWLEHLSRLEKLEIFSSKVWGMEEEEQKGKSSRGWQSLSSLRMLKLEGIRNVKTLPLGIACVTSLENLEVKDMQDLTELPQEIGNLSLLRQLRVDRCPKVKSLPPSILRLPNLQELYIKEMGDLTELPGRNGDDNVLLHVLDVEKCPQVKSLPPSILTSLKELRIVDCPIADKIVPRGEDWRLIKHIPKLKIMISGLETINHTDEPYSIKFQGMRSTVDALLGRSHSSQHDSDEESMKEQTISTTIGCTVEKRGRKHKQSSKKSSEDEL